MSVSSCYGGREASPTEGAGIYNGVTLSSAVDAREAQRSLARLQGGESLLASLRSLVAGGSNIAELNTVAVFGKRAGGGTKSIALIDQEE